MPHAIPPFRTSLPRIRHANWKSGGAASVCRRNAFTRDRHATTPSIAARKDATILRTSPLSRFPSNYPFDKILAMRFRAIVQLYTRRDWFRTGRIIVGEDTVEFDNIYGRIGSTVRTNLNFKLALLQDRVVESEDTKLDHLKSGSAVRSRGGKKVKTVRSAWFLVSDIADSRSLYLGKLTRKALFVAVFIIGRLNGHDPFPD